MQNFDYLILARSTCFELLSTFLLRVGQTFMQISLDEFCTIRLQIA